jgi:hypothetical protein
VTADELAARRAAKQTAAASGTEPAAERPPGVPRHPEITVTLTPADTVDRFKVLGNVLRALNAAGATDDETRLYIAESGRIPDAGHALKTAAEWVTVRRSPTP